MEKKPQFQWLAAYVAANPDAKPASAWRHLRGTALASGLFPWLESADETTVTVRPHPWSPARRWRYSAFERTFLLYRKKAASVRVSLQAWQPVENCPEN